MLQYDEMNFKHVSRKCKERVHSEIPTFNYYTKNQPTLIFFLQKWFSFLLQCFSLLNLHIWNLHHTIHQNNPDLIAILNCIQIFCQNKILFDDITKLNKIQSCFWHQVNRLFEWCKAKNYWASGPFSWLWDFVWIAWFAAIWWPV